MTDRSAYTIAEPVGAVPNNLATCDGPAAQALCGSERFYVGPFALGGSSGNQKQGIRGRGTNAARCKGIQVHLLQESDRKMLQVQCLSASADSGVRLPRVLAEGDVHRVQDRIGATQQSSEGNEGDGRIGWDSIRGREGYGRRIAEGDIVTKNCAQCGAEFYVRPSHAPKRFHCSMACMAETYKTQLKGKNNPHYKGVGWCICEICGKRYHSYNYKTRRFCSHSCASKTPENIARLAGIGHVFQIGNKEGSKRKRTFKTTKICAECETVFPVTRNTRFRKYCKRCSPKGRYQETRQCIICGTEFTVTRTHQKKTCSAECLSTHRAAIQKGSLSHRWQGGKTSAAMILRGSLEYSRWREEVFRRDDFTCYATGIRGGKLTAHHILTVAEHPELIFDVDNGITLSWKYHSSIRWHEAEHVAEFQDALRKQNGGGPCVTSMNIL